MTDTLPAAAADWRRDGVLHLPGFLDATRSARLRAICDRILEQWYAERGARPVERLTNIAWLTEPRYFAGREDELIELLALVADPAVLDLLAGIGAADALFHNTQYFARPPKGAWHGIWHRDTQFRAEDPELERRRIAKSQGLHFRVALAPDEQLWLVPGSHDRWDSPAELAIRRSPDPEVRSEGEMPGARQIRLAPGDGLLFHAWSIHQGRYDQDRDRATFDVLYHAGGICDYAVPPPTCFRDADLLGRLPSRAQAFFGRFVEAYRPFWDA